MAAPPSLVATRHPVVLPSTYSRTRSIGLAMAISIDNRHSAPSRFPTAIIRHAKIATRRVTVASARGITRAYSGRSRVTPMESS